MVMMGPHQRTTRERLIPASRATDEYIRSNHDPELIGWHKVCGSFDTDIPSLYSVRSPVTVAFLCTDTKRR